MVDNNILLVCLIINDSHEPVGNAFPVDVPPNHFFHQLADKIIENGPTLLGYKAADLFLWKPKNDLPLVDPDLVHINHDTFKKDNSLLLVSSTVGEEFKAPLPKKCVHLLAQLVRDQVTSRSSRLSAISPLVTNTNAIVQKHINIGRGMKSPSLGATAENFASIQAEHRILNGRPFATCATPVHLYHSVFTTFTRIFEDETMRIPPDIQGHIFDLCDVSSELYGSNQSTQRKGESERMQAIRPIYQLILDEWIEPANTGSCIPDRVITTGMNDGALALRAIFKVKNEIGTDGYDPNARAALSYVKSWVELETMAYKCCCPSFVIDIAGPWIVIHGAVLCDAGWIVQPLTDMVNLQFDPYNRGRMIRIARLFLALRNSLKELDTFYKELEDKPASIIWPSICSYKETFQYQGRLFPESPSKMVFLAHTPNNEKIVVKFTNSYCIEAHHLLEAKGLAPRVLYFSGGDATFEKPGELLEMVVMEYVEGMSTSGLTEEGKEDIRDAVRVLHGAGYVFGELRGPNILTLEDGHAKIIDFDHCGIENQVFYPMGLDPEIAWPSGAKPGCPVKRSDDLFMLEQLGISLS